MKHELTARRLNEALNEAGLTPQELSRKSGVGKASISQYRNGTHKPGDKSAGKMGKVLNVEPLWLMGYDAPKHTEDYGDIFFRIKDIVITSEMIDAHLKASTKERLELWEKRLAELIKEKEGDK